MSWAIQQQTDDRYSVVEGETVIAMDLSAADAKRIVEAWDIRRALS